MDQYPHPKVLVLLATFNGANYLPAQLDSILNQQKVAVHIVISDDQSSDDTPNVLSKLSDERFEVLPSVTILGSAGKNFYRLILDAKIDGYDYIAFADQDDIWGQDKLINHIQLAKYNQADGVSSNVMAFWSNGENKEIIKSQPQKKWDFLFESAGPGCTFLMTPWLINKVREQLMDAQSPARQVILHDWLTYAICRAHGHKWIIDSTPSMLYRQHSNNVVGANIGLKAKLARLKKLKQGWYRAEVIKVAAVVALISDNAGLKKLNKLLNQKSFISQIKLLLYVPQARRFALDRFVLFVLIASFVF
ncbi:MULTISPECIES: glycosyltransferase [Methylotenera]|uniref:glycosyltransferase n=1 Tax=Methylotenera TaxID=359407 RepID=UPI000367CE3A|nr:MULTISPECIES: glycosyltransferase [Methylotenera]